MEISDMEYLKLFQQVKEKEYTFEDLRNNSLDKPLNETRLYKGNNSLYDFNQNLNEVYRQEYSQDYNLNEFNIETRINGQNINEVKRQQKEDRLNEVMEHLRQERLKAQEEQSINEKVNFENVDVVSLEMFNKARVNSMMQIANKIR